MKHLFARGAFLCEKIKNGLDTEYYRQALEYWTIVRRFVCNMLDAYYPSEADKNVFVNDRELHRYRLRWPRAGSRLLQQPCSSRRHPQRFSSPHRDGAVA